VRVGFDVLKTGVVLVVTVSLVVAGIPRVGARTTAGPARAVAADAAAAEPHGEYFLRDAVPATWTPEPPDTVVDDDFFLPEETDRGKLYRDIAVFIIASAMVAFFIIKVFIEEDDEPAPDDDNGKDIPPPR
jgi:hypothetical protein